MLKPKIQSRNYTFLGTTQSLCPECLSVVPSKIISRNNRVYFRKTCKEHDVREDFICSDVRWYDRYDYALPARVPAQTFVEPKNGCPLDCGLCSEHEQHTCIGVLEITDGCNLTCPMCYAGSSPGQKHRTLDEVKRAIDTLVTGEGRPEVLQISGGEPTIHPELETILDYALSQPIDYIMLNTNGIRLATDDRLLAKLAENRDRVEIYFQLDGLNDSVFRALRGAELLDTKLKALERIGNSGLHATIVATLQPGVNDDQLGPLVQFAAERPWITGLSLQPATYSGRHVLPADLEKRITFPDVIRGLCEQTDGLFQEEDFFPLPCAHPNCHILSLSFRHAGQLIPLTRFVDAKANLDLLANGLSFTRDEGQRLVKQYLARQSCCGPGGCGDSDLFTLEMNDVVHASSAINSFDHVADPKPLTPGPSPLSTGARGERDLNEMTNPMELTGEGLRRNESSSASTEFFAQALAKQLGAEQLLRITITSFLDAYNFDVRRVMKCCTHHVLPSGHIIPFCAYNVLYRNGHVPLPPLRTVLSV